MYMMFHIFNCILRHLHIRVYMYYELTYRPAPRWLDSSVGRALHWYRRGHGLESRLSLIFFRLRFHDCLSCVHNCDDQSGVLTIYMYMGKPVGKSNGSRHSTWEASGNMGCDLR